MKFDVSDKSLIISRCVLYIWKDAASCTVLV